MLSRMVQAAGFDPITVVEAAYDLGVSDREWLSRLVAATAPALDGGVGTSAALWQLPVEGGQVTALDVSTRSELLALAPIIYGAIGNSAPRYYTHVPELQAASDYASDPTLQGILRLCSTKLGTELRDIVGVRVGDGRRSGVAITSFAAAPTRFSIRRRETFHRIALHIGAGLRLRARAASGAWCAADAVLDGSGRMLHAEGDARASTAREALSNAVRAIDRARGSLRRHDPDEALTVWRALVAGKWSVVEWTDSDGRRLLVAHMNPIDAEDPRRLSGREREVAEFLIHGRSNAEISYALGLAVGHVNRIVRSVLRKLGHARRTDLARVFGAPELRLGRIDEAEQLVLLDGASREGALWDDLTSAERVVVQRTLSGDSNREIARQRGRSEHTIANQLAAVYARFGVRGRTELAALLGPAPSS
jgi:DNA-binding NarL/FixJ family response regulator